MAALMNTEQALMMLSEIHSDSEMEVDSDEDEEAVVMKA